ncbi:MAG: YtpR family tRNA-binding protein [Mycoplasmoidaceae bacterium]
MLNLFYQNKTLNDTLIINVIDQEPTRVVVNGDTTIGFVGEKIGFANIKNAISHFPNLKEGLLFPYPEFLDQIIKVSGIDFHPCFINGFIIGLIESCEDIKGTHLHKCKVNIGNKILDIVCGAPNARQGLKVVVATDGTMLPSGKQIISGQLLGNKSEGMLCSYKELNINKESKGIIELPDDSQVGQYYMEVYANKK